MTELLFHVCCAPCATVGVASLQQEYSLELYYYGGNIHPQSEWRKRLEGLEILSQSSGTRLHARPFDTDEWHERVSGLEDEPERGQRCEICMKLQLEKAAQYAERKQIKHLCTSLTLSPQKDPALINSWGAAIAGHYGLFWVNRIWRKNGGFQKSVEESKRLSLYRQNYCGCCYSMGRLLKKGAALDGIFCHDKGTNPAFEGKAC